MPRKLPALNDDNRAFWQGGQNNQLLIHRCNNCTYFLHPPAPICPRCASLEVAPHHVSGKGKVVSYTVNHQQWNNDLDSPYVIAIIELMEQEGLRFVSNVVGMDPSQVYIDMPVRVGFMHVEDVWLPLFERAQ